MVDPSEYDRILEGPIDGEPDPEAVGPSIMAWYALHNSLQGGGSRATEIVAWAAETIASRLSTIGPDCVNPLTPEDAWIAVEDARRLLGMVAEMFGGGDLPAEAEEALAFKAELKHRRGRPAQPTVNLHSLGWWFVAKEVEDLIAAGKLQKVAVGEVATRLGIKDNVVANWCRRRRQYLDQSSA